MRSLRNVIARKRPMPASRVQEDGQEQQEQVTDFCDLDAVRAQLAEMDEPVEQAIEEPVTPEVQTSEPEMAASPAPKRQIWDIDQEDEVEEAPQPRLSRRPTVNDEGEFAPRRARVAPETAAEPAKPVVEPARPARVKTRIIGFHAGDMETDVFAGAKAAPSAPEQFPAGWIVVVDGPGRGASFTVAAGVSTIGRDPAQTICLDFGDTSVSRENHASIAYDEEQNKFFVGHGGKSNIVRRNGSPVLSTEELSGGDLIRIGKTTLRFVALCGPDFTWGGDDDRQDADAPAV